MAAPVTAPYAPSYATYTPYLTPAEYLAEPTGVSTSQLIPRSASPNAQTAALTRIIGRASSWADRICHQVLAATLDVQSGEYRILADGTIRVPVDNTPLIQVTDVQIGQRAGALSPLADLSGCWLGRKVVRIPVASCGGTRLAGPSARSAAGRLFAAVTYVNGYAHAPSTAAAVAGASTIQVRNPLGIFPGLPLTLYDGAANGLNTEQVIVDGTYTSGATVPLASPLLYGHAAGISVSALPGFAREAVISLTSALIKTRGADAFVMPSGPGRAASKVAPQLPGADEDYAVALELLGPLARVW